MAPNRATRRAWARGRGVGSTRAPGTTRLGAREYTRHRNRDPDAVVRARDAARTARARPADRDDASTEDATTETDEARLVFMGAQP